MGYYLNRVAILMPSSTGFGNRLRQLREATGLTQAELAERAGLNKFGVAKLEQGLREPAWPTVLALSEALGCSPNDFRTTSEEEKEVTPRPMGRPRKAKPGRPSKRPRKRRER